MIHSYILLPNVGIYGSCMTCPAGLLCRRRGKCKVLWNSCPWTWIIFVLLDIRNFQSGTMLRQTRAYTMLCRRRLLWCYKSNRTTLRCSRLLRTWLSDKNGIYCAPRGQDHGCFVTRLMGKRDGQLQSTLSPEWQVQPWPSAGHTHTCSLVLGETSRARCVLQPLLSLYGIEHACSANPSKHFSVRQMLNTSV